MAIYSITTEGERALAAATARTALQLRGASACKPRVIAWGISFDGQTASNAPGIVRLLRQTTDGTNSGCTEVLWDPDDPTANCAGYCNFSSTEPTASDVLETFEVHPQGGSIVREYPPGRQPTLDNATTSRLGIECNFPDAVNFVAFLVWEE